MILILVILIFVSVHPKTLFDICSEIYPGSVLRLFETNCYALQADSPIKSWMDSNTYCESAIQGSHLVSIHSLPENEVVNELREICNTINSNCHNVWIGARNDLTGSYEWTDGSPWDYTNWYPGEPNHQYGEHYVFMWGQHKWNDDRNTPVHMHETGVCKYHFPSYYFDCLETPVSFNTSEICLNHGECKQKVGLQHGECFCDHRFDGQYCGDCNYGYIGEECRLTSCYGILSNLTKSCGDHGDCTGYNQCTCSSGYFGHVCHITECFGFLSNDSRSCSNDHGVCIDHNICQCHQPEIYYGQNCEKVTECYGIMGNESSVCSGHGKCVRGKFEGSYCVCDDGYESLTKCAIYEPSNKHQDNYQVKSGQNAIWIVSFVVSVFVLMLTCLLLIFCCGFVFCLFLMFGFMLFVVFSGILVLWTGKKSSTEFLDGSIQMEEVERQDASLINNETIDGYDPIDDGEAGDILL